MQKTKNINSGQNDPIQLADFQSSECGVMYRVKPGFLRNETIGDTTFVDLFCTNNCSGYHDPTATLSGDSVMITVSYGRRAVQYVLLNGEYLDDNELSLHAKDSILMQETSMMAACDCCFIFKLKILGLDSTKKYMYFYNEQFVDPEFKTKIRTE